MEQAEQRRFETVTEQPLVLRRDAGPVAILTLNRPEQRNALSEAMLAALQEQLRSIAEEPGSRAVVIAASGAAFSAGHDLKELRAHGQDPDQGRSFYMRIMAACSRLMLEIVRLPKPVIAAVDGIATAAGCQLVASCDLAVASPQSRFATPGVNIGLFCSTPMVALSRSVPRKAAMEMLLTGEPIDAEEAKRIGLINRVVPGEDVLATAIGMGELIAAKPRHTLKIGKEAFYAQAELSLDEAYGYAATVMVDNLLHGEACEGIAAFLEKRPPDWPGEA